MRTTLYLDKEIINRIQKLAEKHGKTNSEIARALVRAGSQVVEKGGISTEGTFLKINRPLVQVKYKNPKGEKKRFGIRLKDLEEEIEEKLETEETVSEHVTNLLKLGLIAHDPSSFKLTGLLDGPRPFTELNTPDINTEELFRKE